MSMAAVVEPVTSLGILLTTYMEESRRTMYRSRIERWLSETPFEIYVVDSSGLESLSIHHGRLHFFSFRQSDGCTSTSVMEADSVVRACRHFFPEACPHELLFKVTGKYFMPGFLKVSKRIPRHADVVFQHNAMYFPGIYGIQYSECIGARPGLLASLMSTVGKANMVMERCLFLLPTTHPSLTFVKMPPLALDRKIARANGTVLRRL